MRNDEPFGREPHVATPEHVEIDDPRAPAFAANTAERLLDAEERFEQRHWIEVRFETECGVQKIRLWRTHRRRFVDGGRANDGSELANPTGGAHELVRAIAEVRAEPNHRVEHVARLCPERSLR